MVRFYFEVPDKQLETAHLSSSGVYENSIKNNKQVTFWIFLWKSINCFKMSIEEIKSQLIRKFEFYQGEILESKEVLFPLKNQRLWQREVLDPLEDQNLDAGIKVENLTTDFTSTKAEFSSETFIEEIKLVLTDNNDCHWQDSFINTSSFWIFRPIKISKQRPYWRGFQSNHLIQNWENRLSFWMKKSNLEFWRRLCLGCEIDLKR